MMPHSTSNAPLRGSELDRQLQEVQASLTLTALQRERSEGTQQLTSALLVSRKRVQNSLPGTNAFIRML